ncbi:hypothetical protein [Paenibacillus sp. UMB4589-SE434]|uniref:hypothetical protein n=1 Tax=Paenibacillus sp. UMB4589-SE434 TaxID=3046314 RepID=UPI00255174EB|nr:hypothetical protein [Paenibacillus sp. UMB4589-SE434]MDK8179537.1 hypothetical protein [Paenibacillus sp. UMB4589-SE434]
MNQVVRKRPALLMLALAVSLFVLSLSPVGTSATTASPLPATPNYEVKLFLDPSLVLNADYNLNSTVLNKFAMPSSKTKMSVQYMDTDQLQLDEQGWNVRLRKKEGSKDKEFELTYKKRYPITNGNIQGALAQAALDGFDANEDSYEAQVDWGYSKQTLSFSNDKKVSKSGYNGMELPSKADSRMLTISNAPGKFKNWTSSNWGTNHLAVADKFGPVDAKRWTGKWNGIKLYIEVWKIIKESGVGYDYVVEASFKTDTHAEASTLRSQLQQELMQQGWFLPIDELKTQMILHRY